MKRIITILSTIFALVGCSSATSNRREGGADGASAEDGSDQSAINAAAAKVPVPLAGVNVADISRVEISSKCLVADCSKKFFQPNILMKSGARHIVDRDTAKPLGVRTIEWTSSKVESCSKDSDDPYSRTCEGPAGSPFTLSLAVNLTFVSGGNSVSGTLSSDSAVSPSSLKIYFAYAEFTTSGSISVNTPNGIFSGPAAADFSCSYTNEFLRRTFPTKNVKWFSPVWNDAVDLKSRLASMGIDAISSSSANDVVFSAPVYTYRAAGGNSITEDLFVPAGANFFSALTNVHSASIWNFNGGGASSAISVWYGKGCHGWTDNSSAMLFGDSFNFGNGSVTQGNTDCANHINIGCMAAVY